MQICAVPSYPIPWDVSHRNPIEMTFLWTSLTFRLPFTLARSLLFSQSTSEFPKRLGPRNPICKFFFHVPNKPKTRCFLKKSLHFELVSDFMIFVPKTWCSLKRKKRFLLGPVSDFIVWITFQAYMFDKFCHDVVDTSCTHY